MESTKTQDWESVQNVTVLTANVYLCLNIKIRRDLFNTPLLAEKKIKVEAL